LAAQPKTAQPAITRYSTIDIQAAGTCTKMIRYESPWVASVGATKKPMYRPASAKPIAASHSQGSRKPLRAKNRDGAAKVNRRMERLIRGPQKKWVAS
jgi:hypothetical protein